MSIFTRFARYLDADTRDKERFLDAVARGEGEAEAVERMGPRFNVATIREWLREDPDFARAVRAARRGGPGVPKVWWGDQTDVPAHLGGGAPWMSDTTQPVDPNAPGMFRRRTDQPPSTAPQLTSAERELLDRELGGSDRPGQVDIPPGQGWTP